jgi:hypothetical protein
VAVGGVGSRLTLLPVDIEPFADFAEESAGVGALGLGGNEDTRRGRGSRSRVSRLADQLRYGFWEGDWATDGSCTGLN